MRWKIAYNYNESTSRDNAFLTIVHKILAFCPFFAQFLTPNNQGKEKTLFWVIIGCMTFIILKE
jgi:hypothetical protein